VKFRFHSVLELGVVKRLWPEIRRKIGTSELERYEMVYAIATFPLPSRYAIRQIHAVANPIADGTPPLRIADRAHLGGIALSDIARRESVVRHRRGRRHPAKQNQA
jgi:hypothetical protein